MVVNGTRLTGCIEHEYWPHVDSKRNACTFSPHHQASKPHSFRTTIQVKLNSVCLNVFDSQADWMVEVCVCVY